MKERLGTLRLGHGALVLTDQAVVSLGTFLTNIAVARALSRDEYGIFVILVGVMLLLNGVHGALVVYPLSVRGAAEKPNQIGLLAGQSLLLTLGLALVFVMAVLVATVIVARPALTVPALLALLAWQLQETARRALMAHLRHGPALVGDGVSYLGQAATVWLVAQFVPLSLELLFLVMALTSGLALLIQAAQVRVRLAWPFAFVASARSNLALGRWLVLGTVLSAPPLQTIPWALALLHGIGEAGALQAAINVIGISHPVMFGISNVIVPAVARARHTGGVGGARRTARIYAAQGAFLLVPFFAVLLVVPRAVLEIFYGPASPYLELDTVLRLFVVVYVLTYVASVLGGLLNGLEQSRSVLFSQIASAAVALVLGLPLVALGGLAGAVAGRLASDTSKVATLVWSLGALCDGDPSAREPRRTAG